MSYGIGGDLDEREELDRPGLSPYGELALASIRDARAALIQAGISLGCAERRIVEVMQERDAAVHRAELAEEQLCALCLGPSTTAFTPCQDAVP